jgi:hypothetical protein
VGLISDIEFNSTNITGAAEISHQAEVFPGFSIKMICVEIIRSVSKLGIVD